MKNCDVENQYDEGMTLEERRLERLRNLLSPFLFLPELMKMNKDGKFDNLIENNIDICIETEPLIRKCLSDGVTLDELNKLYLTN
jgi:hypothetical protein